MSPILSSVRDAVGNTPLVALSRFGADYSQSLFGKCEFMNPGGSVKDRIGFHLVEEAERQGLLKPGGTIVEATAGNTGLALASAAAIKGYRLITVITNKVSREKVRLLQACGAETLVIPFAPTKGGEPDYIQKARDIARGIPGAWFVDQYRNTHNPEAHYQGTGPELWEQTGGEIDVLVCGMGTGGTLSGTGTYLKEKNPNLKIVMADPSNSILNKLILNEEAKAHPYWIEGIGASYKPENANLDLVDEIYPIKDEVAIETAFTTFRTEGMFVGGSAGCLMAAAQRYCEDNPGGEEKVVIVLPDSGRAYLSTIFNPDWCQEKGLEVNFPFEM